MSKILTETLKGINKSEKEILSENVTNIIEDCTVDCNSQISIIKTSTLPRLQNNLTRAERNLDKAQKEAEKVRFNFSNIFSFENYIQKREQSQDKVESANEEVLQVKIEIEEANAQLKAYETILADLQAE